MSPLPHDMVRRKQRRPTCTDILHLTLKSAPTRFTIYLVICRPIGVLEVAQMLIAIFRNLEERIQSFRRWLLHDTSENRLAEDQIEKGSPQCKMGQKRLVLDMNQTSLGRITQENNAWQDEALVLCIINHSVSFRSD